MKVRSRERVGCEGSKMSGRRRAASPEDKKRAREAGHSRGKRGSQGSQVDGERREPSSGGRRDRGGVTGEETSLSEWERLREAVMQLQELHRWQSRLLADMAARVEGMRSRERLSTGQNDSGR